VYEPVQDGEPPHHSAPAQRADPRPSPHNGSSATGGGSVDVSGGGDGAGRRRGRRGHRQGDRPQHRAPAQCAGPLPHGERGSVASGGGGVDPTAAVDGSARARHVKPGPRQGHEGEARPPAESQPCHVAEGLADPPAADQRRRKPRGRRGGRGSRPCDVAAAGKCEVKLIGGQLSSAVEEASAESARTRRTLPPPRRSSRHWWLFTATTRTGTPTVRCAYK
jgi:hypothetical protein